MKKAVCIILLALTFAASFFVRETNISTRVPHADESEQASTFAKLLDSGSYIYNPNGPHGPTLYYYAYLCYAMPMLKSFDMASEANIDTDTPVQSKRDGISIPLLRKLLTPWLFCVFLLYLIGAASSGRAAAWGACAAFALSGLSCIYAGYFVHEIIFATAVFATAQCAWEFLKKPSWGWAATCGLCAGFAQATKETSVIAFFAIAVAAAAVVLPFGKLRRELFGLGVRKFFGYSLSFALGFAAVLCVFYSSFGANPSGIADAFLSYGHFFEKSANRDFSEPFWYYVNLLGVSKNGGVNFGELPICLLALVGTLRAAFVFFRKDDGVEKRRAAYALFCAFNAAVQIAVLSSLTYKTPWLLLSPMVFVCAAAGYAIGWLLESRRAAVWIASAALLAGLGYWQYLLTANATLRYAQDPRNPMIFAHTVGDYKNLLKRIASAEKFSEYKGDIPVAFIMGGESPWPAPWDLRNYRNAGFWGAEIPQNLADFEVIVCAPQTADAVEKLLQGKGYTTEFFGLRNNVLLTVFIKREIFDKIIQ